jgi:hypothetical protein
MGHVRQRTKLLLESVEAFRRDVAQRLQGDEGFALAVQDLVDDAESAGPEAALDGESVVAPEVSEGREWLFDEALC